MKSYHDVSCQVNALCGLQRVQHNPKNIGQRTKMGQRSDRRNQS